MITKFSERLRNLRKANELSQSQLAYKSNIEPNSYGRYERGERIPPSDILLRLANTLNCTTDYLLGRTSEPNLVNMTDLPEELTSEGIEALEITREAMANGLSAEDIKDIIEMALKLRKKD